MKKHDAVAQSAALPFWKTTALADMSAKEWDSLCDGCGKCCLLKLEDADTGEIEFTDVACKLLDCGTCRCTDYRRRKKVVPTCVVLTPGNVDAISWMPSTCAYRLVADGRDLAWWHPLVSGDPESVHRAGVSARGRVVTEGQARDLDAHIVTWPA